MRPTDCGVGRHGIWYGCKLIGLGQYIVALSVVREYVSLHFLRHLLRCDILHAWIAALVTGLVAVYAAWSALHVYADDIVLALAPSHETGQWMCRSPDTDDGDAYERREVHIA